MKFNLNNTFTPSELNCLLDKADGMFKLFLTIAVHTGMRTGEILRLSWNDIDLDNNRILVPSKTLPNDPRIIILPLQVKQHVQSLPPFPQSQKIFANWNISVLSRKYWKPLLDKCAVGERGMYMLRASYVMGSETK